MTANRLPERAWSIEAAAAAGLVFAVAYLASWFLLQSPPDHSASDAEISAWYEDPGNRQGVLIGLTLAVISAIAFLWFVAVVRRRVGDREDKFFGTVFFGSGLLLTGVMLVGTAALASGAVTTARAPGSGPGGSGKRDLSSSITSRVSAMRTARPR